jgi:hypothetical protein
VDALWIAQSVLHREESALLRTEVTRPRVTHDQLAGAMFDPLPKP